MSTGHPAPLKIARVYMRVSTDDQDVQRQEHLLASARAAGYYVAGTYAEAASGTRTDRAELQRMLRDLQPGDVVIAEKIDRLSRLPLGEAEQLVGAIRAKGARLAVPGLVDLSEVAEGADGVTKIVLDALQSLLLRLALQMARDDYETRRDRQLQGVAIGKLNGVYKGRPPDLELHARVRALRPHHSIAETARLAGCSASTVKKICPAAQRRQTSAGGDLRASNA